MDNTTAVEKQEIAENLNKYFTNIGPSLTSKIPNKQGGFEKYLPNCNTVINDTLLTHEEVRNVFYSLKTSENSDYDDISLNAIHNIFDYIVEPLRYILSNSLAQGNFPEEMKIAKITLIYKSGDKENVVNYRLISALLCFSKTPERIMYKRLYLYLTGNNLLYNKQFGFQKGHFTDHAIFQIPDQIHRIFNKNIFTLGVFIDMFKAFDTVNHKILLTIYLLLVIFLTGNSL